MTYTKNRRLNLYPFIEASIRPIPNVNINKHRTTKGSSMCHIQSPVPVKMITKYNGINVSKKLIPTNKHFSNGNIYFGIYILFNNAKFATTELIDKFVASVI